MVPTLTTGNRLSKLMCSLWYFGSLPKNNCKKKSRPDHLPGYARHGDYVFSQIMETSMTESSGGVSDESDFLASSPGGDASSTCGISPSQTSDSLFRYVRLFSACSSVCLSRSVTSHLGFVHSQRNRNVSEGKIVNWIFCGETKDFCNNLFSIST